MAFGPYTFTDTGIIAIVTQLCLLPDAQVVASISQVKSKVMDLAFKKLGAKHLEGCSQSLESIILQWVEKQPSWYSAAYISHSRASTQPNKWTPLR